MKLCISLLYPSITTIFFIFVWTSTTHVHVSYAQEDYKLCQNNYTCGEVVNVGYPFWGGDRPDICGPPGFNLSCQNDESGYFSVIDMEGFRYRVVQIDTPSNRLRIARDDLWKLSCDVNDELEHDTKLNNMFDFVDNVNENLSLFYSSSCPGFDLKDAYNYKCSSTTTSIYYLNESQFEETPSLNDCSDKIIKVPILNINVDKLITERSWNLQESLNAGFDVEYTEIGEWCHDSCESKGKLCVMTMMCVDKPAAGGGMSTVIKAAIGVAAAFTGAFLTFLGFCIYLRRKKRIETKSLILSRNISSEPSSKMDMEKGDVSFGFGVQVFTYDELVEATDNFASDRELGDGGFGTVYYGKLQDGRNVAVKRLYESNYKRVEQFMNEVKLLAGLRHKNLVLLYGCTSRHSRELLLVYEYIPNGTLADHLHGEYARPGALPWVIRLNTAIETADALTYLHKTDIIHRDIKTNNILLDKNFTVKVADFGLSRLFPVNATHVSTAPQGTPGYVDPEYHQYYQLTDKSDVFSFGVVLIELISSMTAVDITRHRHEINLSTMAINKIQNQTLHELVDPNLGFDSDKEIKRMITDVAECAFQCLQHEKDMRPSMEEVLETLQRIKNLDYDKPKLQGVDILAPDDAALLKKVQFSPVSVTVDWGSRTTTPNSSS